MISRIVFFTVLALIGICFELAALDPDHFDEHGVLRSPIATILQQRQPLPRAASAGKESVVNFKTGIVVASRPKDSPYPSLLSKNIIVGFYGSPYSKRMGILGEQSIEETGKLLKAKIDVYDAINGDEGVIGAFHLIYATVWADANLGFLSDSKILAYVEYATANNMIVILDHQLGRYSVADSVKRMLPWLKYSNVHLAIDPEWKTLNPGKEIGSISAEDVNLAQKLIQDYMVKEGLEQRRMFIVHQFHHRMIANRDRVTDIFDRVDLVHNADGFGAPQLKMDTYRYIANATNMPLKGFKLFYPKSWKTLGFDKPLMSPEDVLKINPRPMYINYQ